MHVHAPHPDDEPERERRSDVQAARPMVGHTAGLSRQAMLALQRSAGNQAVAQLLRQGPQGDAGAGPADGGGASLPGGVTTPPATSTGDTGETDASDVVLPETDTAFSFQISTSEHRLPLDLSELPDFEFGKGSLSTGAFPLGDTGVQADFSLGADEGVQLRNPAIVLTPIVAEISAEQVKQEREDIAEREGESLPGKIGAAYGGSSDPFGWLGGAQAGRKLGGMLADRSAMPAHKLKARIVSGRLQGEFDLHYRPWFKVVGSLVGFSWLAEASVRLDTDIGMKVIPALDFGAAGDGSTGVELTFRGGRLEHSAFTLKAPTPKLDVVFRAFGVLDAELRAFKLLDGSKRDSPPSENPGVQLLHERSAPFPIVEGLQLPIIGDEATLDAEKGSPAKFNKKKIRPKPGDVGKSFTSDGLRHLQWGWPFKTPEQVPGGDRHTGKTEADAIPMTWYKPVSAYPKSLKRRRPGKDAQTINAFPHKHYADGDFDLGVDGEFWPWEGKKLQRISEARGPGVPWFKEDLDSLGMDVDAQLGYVAQIDHVQDLAWQGPDDERNLWPLEATANMKAGWEQNLQQEVTWLPDEAVMPVRSSILHVPKGRWFVIEKITEPTGIAPQ